MTRTRINRHRLKRILAPGAGLWRQAFVAFIGLTVLLVGIGVTFRAVLSPVFSSAALAWNRLVQSFVPTESVAATNHMLGGLLLFLGLYLMYWGARSTVRQLGAVLSPGSDGDVVDVYVRRQQLALGPRIVALGGGTGLSTLLRGLKQHSSNLTAIVTVTDDGGSSGRLVQDMGILPPGDMRNCLVALADAERRMVELFQHRFQSAGGSFSGHSVGNLLLAGLVDQSGGDVDQALRLASEVLNIRGQVVPSTMDHVRLRALLEDGTEICGETAIVASRKRIRRIYLDPEDCQPHADAIAAIRDADIVCVGPGSVYTSVIPNLLVPGIAEAIADSGAIRVYVCNVMTQRGESDAFTAAEHLVALQANVDQRVCDYVLVNTGTPSQAALDRYKESEQEFVTPDTDRLTAMGYRPVTGDFMSETDFVRHDPNRVADRIVGLLYR